jgi:hypothetical protein
MGNNTKDPNRYEKVRINCRIPGTTRNGDFPDATLDALLALLYRIAGKEWHGPGREETFAEFDSGSALLEKHTVESLGEAPAGRNIRIMVTMPSEAADDPNLVRDFLNGGMNIMRINCAHDSAEEWLRMVENLRAAQKETGKPCKIAFDLAGPKLRTGPVGPSPGIIRWKPERNELGQVMTSAFITFYTGSHSSEGETIPIPEFATEYGDLVSLSFVRRPEDVAELIGELDRFGARDTGIILKIEPTRGRSFAANSTHGNEPASDCRNGRPG